MLPANPPFTPAETGYVGATSHAGIGSAKTGMLSTTRGSVVRRISSGTICTASSCWCGKTSRNQPMHPASTSEAPRTLTDKLVTSPAHRRVVPKAKMKGHAVGAGTSIGRGVRHVSFNCSVANSVAMSTSASENINYGKNHNPYGVDEMPVHREHFDVTRLLHSHTATKSEQRNRREHDETCGDVKRVQPDEGVICCPEQVGRDRQPVFVDQPVPFLRCAVEEQATECNGEQPESKECKPNAACQKLCGDVNGQAAGQQAHRVEDRRFKDLAWCRSRQTLPQVKEIGDNEDREDRRFGNDETGHRHLPTRWQMPCDR